MTYVMSDIHGNEKRFNDIMNQIKLNPDDTLYILGDVIDRGEGGIRILRRVMASENIKMILGNHEYMMLNALYRAKPFEHEKTMRLWYHNGGNVTHYYLKHYRLTVRDEIFEYLNSLPINIEIEVSGEQYILVHAAIQENYSLHEASYDDSVEYAVWSRRSEYDPVPEGKIMIFGHTPTSNYQADIPMRIWCGDRRIGIDCGCAYGKHGALACIRLDDMKVFYSE